MTPGIVAGISSAPDEQAAGAPPFDCSGSLIDRFERVASEYASRPAISDAEGEWTYARLREVQDGVRSAIAAEGRHQDVVAVLLPNDKRFSAAILGVLAAGRVCLPLDAEHPIERNRRIAAKAGVAAVITAGALGSRAADLFPGVRELDFDALTPHASRPDDRPPGGDDVAYILYSSGSSGEPKGVYWDHRSVLHDVSQNVHAMGIGPADRVAMFYAPSVLAGIRTCLTTLLSGASGHVMSMTMGARELGRMIRARQLTVLRSSPALFRHVVESLRPDERLESVRLVLVGGDRVSWNDFDVFKRGCGAGARFGVHLGATECSIHTEWLVDESAREKGARLPVGWPLQERAVRLLDVHGQPVGDGQIGECVVAGRFIARGYWCDAERTDRAFMRDPADPAIRMYKTGDLARRRQDGLLEYVGRKDEQIKLGGRRVEPGEIESALRSCAGIQDAAVVVRRSSDGTARALVAYVEPQPHTHGLLPRHVKAMLLALVPRHMIPAQIVFMARLPRLTTLKIDRVALKNIDAEAARAPSSTPDDPVVQNIIDVFEDTLRIQGVRPEDNLASLGGDSLQALEVLKRLERRLGLRLPFDQLEAAGSIGDLAASLSRTLEQRNLAAVSRATRPRRGRAEALPPPQRHDRDRWRTVANDLLRAASCPREREPMAVHVPDRRDLGTWVGDIDAMIRGGALEAARVEIEALGREHPIKFAQTWARIFSLVPPPDAEIDSFVDDGQQDVQLVVRPGADAVLVVFAGHNNTFGVPTPVLHRWLARLPVHVLYLRDPRKCHYFKGVPEFGDDRATTIAAILYIARELGAARLLCWGHSAGAVASLQYGLELEAEAVVSAAGPINFTRDFNIYLRWGWLASRLRRVAAQEIVDIRQRIAEAARPPRTLLVYGADYWDDRLQAEYLRGIPSVTHLPIAHDTDHQAIRELVRRGWYPTLLEWLVTPGGCPLPEEIPDSSDQPIASPCALVQTAK